MSAIHRSRRAAAGDRPAPLPPTPRVTARALGLALLLFRTAGPSAHGAEVSPLADPGTDTRNRFRIGAQATFRIQLELRTTGGTLAHAAGPSTGSALDRSYDDGFVRVDSSGNAGGATWNWGYRSDAQVVNGGSAIEFHALEGNPYSGSQTAASDPHWGTELGFTRILGPLPRGGAWGIDATFGWTPLDLSGSHNATGSITRLSDAFALDGVLPPSAPYAGSDLGPGPLLSDSPVRTTSSVATRTSGRHRLDADLFLLTVGPSLEMPLGSGRLTGRLSAGLAVGHLDGRFEFAESATLADGRTWVRSGAAQERDWILGGHARAELLWRVADGWYLQGGAGVVSMESPVVRAPGREARLGFGATLQLTAGLSVAF